MRPILTGVALAILIGASITAAHADCTCRARGGVEALLGQTVCIATSNGPRLARCEQVLNNTSWRFLNQPCPQAQFNMSRETLTARSTLQSRAIVR